MNETEGKVILVDEQDIETGIIPKLEAHQLGLLHRAFSVFIFNKTGELLLQQRAMEKYHSAGLWSNTCCSHPMPGEISSDAARRRLKEEMGISCDLEPAFHFVYRAELDNNLTEYEFDHVFIGYSDDLPVINRAEVKDYKYLDMPTLANSIQINPEAYTSWLIICLPKLMLKYSVLNREK